MGNMHQDIPVNDICWKFITFVFLYKSQLQDMYLYISTIYTCFDNRTQLDNQTTLVQNQGCHTVIINQHPISTLHPHTGCSPIPKWFCFRASPFTFLQIWKHLDLLCCPHSCPLTRANSPVSFGQLNSMEWSINSRLWSTVLANPSPPSYTSSFHLFQGLVNQFSHKPWSLN
jgi:hypothetical protein